MGMEKAARGRVLVQVKRGFLLVFLTVTGIAVLGVVGLLVISPTGNYDDALVTSLGAGWLLVLCMLAMTGVDRVILRTFVMAGWAVSGLMMVTLPVWAWLDTTYRYRSYRAGSYPPEVREFGKWSFMGVVLASWLCLVPSIAGPRLRGPGRVVQGVSIAALTVAGVLMGVLQFQDTAVDREMVTAMLAALVIGAAGGLAVLGLNKFSLLKVREPVSLTATTIRLFCPRCGRDQEVGMGESACSACKLKFVIDVEEPRCENCGYNLHKLEAERCPECGWAVGTRAAAAV